jgi:protein gp37
MAENSKISWTHHTFNPWRGCTKVSPGCAHCYAESLSKRNHAVHGIWGPNGTRVVATAAWKDLPKWNRAAMRDGERRRVFCGSMCDWCEDHPIAEATRPRLWDTIRSTPYLDWLMLTKRADRLADCLPADWGEGWPHVWLGVSIENNDYAWRADYLRAIPAVVRFVSYEPALGPLDSLDLAGVDWVIYGGESGAGFRPEDKQWARDMRDRCRAEGVAIFHKQSAAFKNETGVELDGETIHQFPTPRRAGEKRTGWEN